MYNLASKLVLALALAMGTTAQVTETVTPNAQEYAHVKSDIASYHSALVTQSLFVAAQSYLKEHSTSVPPIGLQLHTSDWSAGISSLNALITTTFAPDFPTVVASLYHSALSEQANIINKDITQDDDSQTSSSASASGTGGASVTNITSLISTPTPTGSSPTSGASSTASPGAANAQMMANGIMIAAGLGAALFL